jgi:branched-chain amino acid transport system substrate-binding protein
MAENSHMNQDSGVSRRKFLASAVVPAAVGAPALLGAQPPPVRIGALHPLTGPLADAGRACRLGAHIAVDAVNAAGGIRSLGGARLELVSGDTEGRPETARSEAARVIEQGARALTGALHSGHTAAIAAVAQERRVPFLVDVSAAEPITASIAQAVRRGDQERQYVFRNFPTTAMSGRRAVQYMTEIFRETGAAPKRAALIYVDDLFGQTQARQFRAAVRALSPPFEIVEAIGFPADATSLAGEVARLKAATPDVIVPVPRPASAIALLREVAKQRVPHQGIVSPGAPGFHEPAQIALLEGLVEHVIVMLPWPNFRNPAAARIGEEYARRTGGKVMEANPGYSCDAILILADALERAGSAAPDALVDAIRATNLPDPVMAGAGPVVFDGTGDNPNASPAAIQILGRRPVPVWPRLVATQPVVFPRPAV